MIFIFFTSFWNQKRSHEIEAHSDTTDIYAYAVLNKLGQPFVLHLQWIGRSALFHKDYCINKRYPPAWTHCRNLWTLAKIPAVNFAQEEAIPFGRIGEGFACSNGCKHGSSLGGNLVAADFVSDVCAGPRKRLFVWLWVFWVWVWGGPHSHWPRVWRWRGLRRWLLLWIPIWSLKGRYMRTWIPYRYDE